MSVLSSSEEGDSPIRQDVLQEETDEDSESSVNSASEYGEVAELLGDPEVATAPSGKVIVDLRWPDSSAPDDEVLQIRTGPSRTTGPPGSEWMDQNPMSFGVAPFWQSLFSGLKREGSRRKNKVNDAVANATPEHKIDGSAEEKGADEGEKDLEAGLGAESDSDDSESLSTLRKLRRPEAAFGKIRREFKDAVMSDDLDENAAHLLRAASGGDAVLLSFLVMELKSPLEKTLDEEGHTALHCAALYGHTQCFKVLLKHEEQSKVRGKRGPHFVGAAHSHKGERRITAGGMAADYFFTCHPHLFTDYQDILVPDKKYWSDEYFEPRSLFFEALRNKEETLFDLLIDAISSESGITDRERLNKPNDNGRTLLELSLVMEDSPMLSLLLSLGATLPRGRPLRLTRLAFGPAEPASGSKLEQLLEKADNVNCTRLELAGITLTKQLAELAQGAIQYSSGGITELCITNCNLDGIESADLLLAVLPPPLPDDYLTTVDLSGMRIGNEGFRRLKDRLRSRVRRLELRACGIDSEGFETVVSQLHYGAYGLGWNGLQHLDLRGNLLGNDAFNAVIDFLKLVWQYAKDDLFNFHLLIWGNRMKAARLKAMMRKTPAPVTQRMRQGVRVDGETMYDAMGHWVDILAGEAELTRACRLAPKARDSSGAIHPEWTSGKPVFMSRAAYFPKYQMKGASQKSLLPTCGICPEQMSSTATAVTTPLLAGQNQKKLRPGEDLALRVPYGAKKMRMLAAERELPAAWSTAKIRSWQRARTWPGEASQPKPWAPEEKFFVQDLTKPSTAETKRKAINNEVRKMLRIPDKAQEDEDLQWPTAKEEQQNSVWELQRIAEKKMHDLEFAQEAALRGQCPGDLTPVRPRTYHLDESRHEKEHKRTAKQDSDSDSDSDLESFEEVEMETTNAADVMKQVMDLDNRMIPWKITKGEKMREWLVGSPQEPWTAALSEPIWEVLPLRLMDDSTATARTGRAGETEEERELREAEAETKKARKKKKKKTRAEADSEKDSPDAMDNIIKVIFSEPPPVEVKTKGIANIKQMLDKNSTPWYVLHFILLIAGSGAATFWTIGLKMAAAVVEQKYDIALPEIWVARYPPEVWAIRAWSLSMLSALIAAIPLLVGHHLWYKSTIGYYKSGGIAVPAFARLQSWLSPVILLLTITWAVAVPFTAIPVVLAHSTLCVFDPSKSDCAEGTTHILRSYKYMFPRSAGYADMLHAALASSIVALASTEAVILYRTLRGHFVVRTSSDEGLSSVQIAGGPGNIGRQVNGLYAEVQDREHQGQPIFRRAQASQWLYLSEEGWRVTHTSKLPRQVDLPVTDKLPPWLHHVRDPDVHAQVRVDLQNAEWEHTSLHRIEGNYRRGRGYTVREQSIFRQKLRVGTRNLPLCIVPDENGGRRAIAKASYPKNTEQWIKEVDVIAAMEKDVNMEALQAAIRGFDADFYKTLEVLKGLNATGQVKRNYEFLPPLAKFLELVGKARLQGRQIEAVKNSEEMKTARANIVQASEGEIKGIERLTKFGSDNLEALLILYVVLLLSGREVPREVDPKRPPGLCQWSILEEGEVMDSDEDEELICDIKQMQGPSDDGTRGGMLWKWTRDWFPHWLLSTDKGTLTELNKVVWQLNVGTSSETAWWFMPDLKATYIPPSRWQPRVGDYLYNFHSQFGIQLVFSSAMVLTDVAFDIAVVTKFIQGGYPYFTAISLFLIIAPSAACWAFLFANGMMEVIDLFLCLSQTAVVMETMQALRSGKVSQNMLWVAVAEACLESLSQTMFQTYCLLIGYGSDKASQGSNQVLIGSVMWGMVNVALVVSMLDLYGRSHTPWGTTVFRWLARYCEVASRVSTLALFAFYFRPSAAGVDMHKSKQRAIFILLAVDYAVFFVLLISRDKGRGFTNAFWAMIACLVAPPCFIESFRSLQPIYYTLRLLELVAMIAAGVISGHGISKLVDNREAYIFLHVAVISTSVWILLNGLVFLWHFPIYLLKFASKRIVKVRVWPLEERCKGELGNGDLFPVKALEIEYDNGTTKRLQEEAKPTQRSSTTNVRRRRGSSRRMSSQGSQDSGLDIVPQELLEQDLDPDDAVQLSLRRGEELVEVKRYKWRYKPKSQCRAGVVFTTSFGRTWGPRQLGDSDDDDDDEEE